jgi:tetratricopeptide (TPR) repeat protein
MLLDFNLAQDWSLRDPARPIADPGGTLVYMAPERLRAIASVPSPAFPSSADTTDPAPDPDAAPGAAAAHVADIYALGMVLLEALTGNPPPPADLDPGGPAQAAKRFRDLAAEYASCRERGARHVIHASLPAGARPIPAALRAILERCLASEPSDRYGCARELAEDLDRWRSDRPLAYASEPFWTLTLPRWMRKKRKLLATAGLLIIVGLLTTFGVLAKSRTLQDLALLKIARNWDVAGSQVFHYQRPGLIRPQDPNDPKILATAVSALKDYDVFGDPNWRQRDDVRTLPEADREDLELWLMEQAFRYARAAEKRPDAPAEWASALTAIDHAVYRSGIRSFEELRRRLEARLAEVGTPDDPLEGMPIAPSGSAEGSSRTGQPAPAPPWLDEYFLGLASELEDGVGARRASAASLGLAAMRSPDQAVEGPDGLTRQPDLPGTRKALDHYGRTLALRPGSFWAEYRAAVVCLRLKRWPEAADHLERCRQRRPSNPRLPAVLASCLREMGRLDDSLRECDRALELAPDYPEFHRSRAFIHAGLGQIRELESDLERFEWLSRFVSRTSSRNPPADGLVDPPPAAVPSSHRASDLGDTPGLAVDPGDPLAHSEGIDPDDLEARAVLAAAISKAGALELATAELEKILVLDPNHLWARSAHMMQELVQGHFHAAEGDLDLVLNHANLLDYLRSDPRNFEFLRDAARQFALRRLVGEALRVANKMFSCSLELGKYQGQSYYTRAAVLGVAAQSDPEQLPIAARLLRLAFMANARFKEWYRQDKLFDPVRAQLDAILEWAGPVRWRS